MTALGREHPRGPVWLGAELIATPKIGTLAESEAGLSPAGSCSAVNARKPGFFAELERRNVFRAAVLYVGAVWALSQGISQLSPAFNLQTDVTRWFVIACAIGFPFWVAFAWFYAWTPHGLKREEDVERNPSLTHSTARKLDFAIIAVLAVAVILLGSGYLIRRGAPAGAPTPTAAAIPQKSVAVLPFTNDSGNKDQQFFSDGLSEDLITALSQFAGLKVISRDSSFQFRDSKDTSGAIGKALGVAHLLEGSVQRAGDEVRITATLVNAADGSVVWSRDYDKPYEDLFALQDAITHAVAGALKAKLLTTPGAVSQSDRPPSGNLTAYAAYLQGQVDTEPETRKRLEDALGNFQKAIRLDPHYALAYVGIAQVWVIRYREGHMSTDGPAEIAHAQAAIRKALALDPDLAAAHAVHCNLLYSMDSDWYGAKAACERALQLAPNDSWAQSLLGSVLATLGQNHAGIAVLQAALRVDPRDAFGWSYLGGLYTATGQLDAADQAIRRAIALQPTMIWTWERLAVVEVRRGNAQQALEFARKEPSLSWRQFGIAIAAQIGPRRPAADAALQVLIASGADTDAYQIAEVYALRGEPDEMFHWLNRAWTQSDAGIEELLSDPFILRYRADPRFTALCKKIGLPTTTDAVAMK